MVDLGTAASIAAIAVPLAGVAIKVISVRGLSGAARAPGTYDGDRVQPRMVCAEHSGVAATLKGLKEGQERIENNIGKIFDKLDEVNK